MGRPLATRIQMIGGFRCFRATGEIELPEASERLLAYLAVKGRPVHRAAIAGVFWPETSDKQALANLRSAIWRMGASQNMVDVGPKALGLKSFVRVDFHEAAALARRLVDQSANVHDRELTAAPEQLREDLLVGWYDDWVVHESERWRQLRLHALESVAIRLTKLGRFSEALDAALLCVEADPLRESAHTVAITTHLAENNRSEALRAFRRYSVVLREELGLEPSESLASLVPATTISLSAGDSLASRK